ncbi:MAG TPA: type 4 pilus major pilin [Scandinavium sp.]|jgi:hypothetical protein
MLKLFRAAYSINTPRKSGEPDRGWGITDQGSAGIIGIIALVVVVGLVWGLWALFNSGSEASNIQDIATKTKGYMGGRGGYNFTSGSTMTGNFIQRGFAPGNMKVVGDETSGTATLWNIWGGQVLLAPVAGSGGMNTGFSITYNSVPLRDCISLAQQFGNGIIFTQMALNSSVHSDGMVSPEDAGKECTRNSGSTGTNTLIFTVNG